MEGKAGSACSRYPLEISKVHPERRGVLGQECVPHGGPLLVGQLPHAPLHSSTRQPTAAHVSTQQRMACACKHACLPQSVSCRTRACAQQRMAHARMSACLSALERANSSCGPRTTQPRPLAHSSTSQCTAAHVGTLHHMLAYSRVHQRTAVYVSVAQTLGTCQCTAVHVSTQPNRSTRHACAGLSSATCPCAHWLWPTRCACAHRFCTHSMHC